MYFAELLPSDDERASADAVYGKFAALVTDAVDFLAKGWKVAEVAAQPDQKYHHATVYMLTRHVCEMLDGVSILAMNGGAEPSKPLLRSSFEAMLGIQYILEADCERRGIAYQVAHAHRRIKSIRRLDPTEQVGKELRKTLADDPLFAGIKFPTGDLKTQVDILEGMLRKPEFAAIETEWQAVKGKGKEPSWFSLFSGPREVRALALHLKHGALYEFLYREWSNSVHAGDCFANIAPGPNGTKLIRPLRHPDGLQQMISLGVSISLAVHSSLLEHYGTQEQRDAARAEYVAKIQQRLTELRQGEIITAPWR